MKRFILLIAFLSPWTVSVAASKSPTEVVSHFGNCLKLYLEGDDDITYRSALDEMTVGKMKCLVDDNVSDEISKQRGLPDGTMHIDDYLTQLRQWSFDEDIEYRMENPVDEKDFEIPALSKDVKVVEPMRVVSARVHLAGDQTYDMTEIFFVRGEMITKIHSITMGENSIGYALWLYNQKKYDEAFRIFRSLAHKNPRNYEAIYYTTVMEIRRQGCSHLSATVRDMEAAAFLYKAKVIGASRDRKAEPFRVTDSSLEELIRLADQAGLDPKKLPYYGLGVCGLFYGRFLLSCENRVIVVKKNRVGFMDDTGKVVIPCKYNLTFGFNKGGYASVSLPNTPMWGYIDRNGKEVVPPEWRSVSYDTKDGKAYVCDESGNAYLIRVATGERILKMDGKYAVNNSFSLGDYVPLVILDSDGNVKEDTKLDIVDFDGNIVFHEVSVQEIDNLHMAIISDGKRVWSTDRHFY